MATDYDTAADDRTANEHSDDRPPIHAGDLSLLGDVGNHLPALIALYRVLHEQECDPDGEQAERITGGTVRNQLTAIYGVKPERSIVNYALKRLEDAGIIEADHDRARGNDWRLTDRGEQWASRLTIPDKARRTVDSETEEN